MTNLEKLVALVAACTPLALGCGADAAPPATYAASPELAVAGDAGALEAPEQGRRGRGHGRGHRDPFARFDRDGDGRIAVAELPERAKEHLLEADANGDGFIEREEMRAAFEKKRAEWKAKADLNGDGSLSEEERVAAFKAHAHERFVRADKNADGALTADEVKDRRWDRMRVADEDGDGRLTEVELEAAFKAGKLGPRGGKHGPRGGRRGGHGGWGGPSGGAPLEGPPGGPAPDQLDVPAEG